MTQIRLAMVLVLFAGRIASAQATIAFQQSTNDGTSNTTYTFTSQAFGTAAADRYVIAEIAARPNSGVNPDAVTAVTIGGITATITRQATHKVTGTSLVAIAIALVPTGTTGTIVVTFNQSQGRCVLAVKRATGIVGLLATSRVVSTANDPTASIDVPANGIAVAIAISAGDPGPGTTTWTGLTEDYEEEATSSVNNISGASAAFGTLQTGLTVTANFTVSTETIGIFAVWGPVGTPPGSIYTHWVTEAGSGSTECEQATPCSLTQAVALVNSGVISPGSVILVRKATDGIYAQNLLTITGSGVAGYPVTFIGETGVRLVGTRTKPTGWTLTATRTYTYEIAWDEVANYTAYTAAQRPPVSTWQPIYVDDHGSGGTPNGRPFYLVQSQMYTPRTSIAEVEAQHCTLWDDTTNNKVYVHMCHDGPPVSADELYLVSFQRGGIQIDGDYIWMENFRMEHVPGTALHVTTTAQGTVLKQWESLCSQFWLEGTNAAPGGSVYDDIDISQVADQGPASDSECWDSNPTFGVGECWNSAGDGRALLFGRQNTSLQYNQVLTNARIHRSWNGVSMDGPNEMSGSIIWGMPNHAMEASGDNGYFHDNVMSNSQDSMLMSVEPFNGIIVEHNLFAGATKFFVAGIGDTCPGCVAPTAWRFRYNIVPSMILDDYTYQNLTMDCNVWMDKSASPSFQLTIEGTDGAPDVGSYDTVAQIRAGTTFDDNSIDLAYTGWSNGTVFVNFHGNETPPWDDPAFDRNLVSPAALTVCGVVAGPAPFVPEEEPTVTIMRMRLNIKGKA